MMNLKHHHFLKIVNDRFSKNKDLVFEQVAQATKAANRSQESVKIIAVTKYVDSGVAARLIDTGIEHIGENRVDMFLEKYEALKDKNLTWHLNRYSTAS